MWLYYKVAARLPQPTCSPNAATFSKPKRCSTRVRKLMARPPQGLDYDRVLYTQDAQAQVLLLLRSRPARVVVSQDSAQVGYRWQENELSEGPDLLFSLVQHNGRWLIQAIRPNRNQ